jgi:hypothetical protein
VAVLNRNKWPVSPEYTQGQSSGFDDGKPVKDTIYFGLV